MANCFGEVVDNDKLDTMPRYLGKKKTQEDRAREASLLINDDGKNNKAITYVNRVKDWVGRHGSTMCLIYNQTGDTLRYVDDKDWLGTVGPSPYPTEIGNGQWAAVVHAGDKEWPGSVGGIVYRGKNRSGNDQDFIICWYSPDSRREENRAYCEISNVGSFQSESRLQQIYNKLLRASYTTDASIGSMSIHVATTSQGPSPYLYAYVMIPYGP